MCYKLLTKYHLYERMDFVFKPFSEIQKEFGFDQITGGNYTNNSMPSIRTHYINSDMVIDFLGNILEIYNIKRENGFEVYDYDYHGNGGIWSGVISWIDSWLGDDGVWYKNEEIGKIIEINDVDFFL